MRLPALFPVPLIQKITMEGDKCTVSTKSFMYPEDTARGRGPDDGQHELFPLRVGPKTHHTSFRNITGAHCL